MSGELEFTVHTCIGAIVGVLFILVLMRIMEHRFFEEEYTKYLKRVLILGICKVWIILVFVFCSLAPDVGIFWGGTIGDAAWMNIFLGHYTIDQVFPTLPQGTQIFISLTLLIVTTCMIAWLSLRQYVSLFAEYTWPYSDGKPKGLDDYLKENEITLP